MSLFDGLALFAALTLLALAPSTSVALVVTRSAAGGFANGAAVTAGIVLGDLVFVCLAVLGMTALAELMGGVFLLIKYIAGAYLIWAGFRLLRSKPVVDLSQCRGTASTLSASFWSGLAITLGDVKAIFFYASLFPAFVDLATITVADIVLITVLTIAGVGGVKLGYAYTAPRLATLVGGRGTQQTAGIAAGAVMVGAGAYLLVKA